MKESIFDVDTTYLSVCHIEDFLTTLACVRGLLYIYKPSPLYGCVFYMQLILYQACINKPLIPIYETIMQADTLLYKHIICMCIIALCDTNGMYLPCQRLCKAQA